MMLKNKVAVIYGAGGAIGSAVARAFAREEAKLFLTGRHRAPVETVAPATALTLEEMANMAVFIASDKASGMTATIVNLRDPRARSKGPESAIQLSSKHPGVKAGPLEIRPAEDSSALVAESRRRRATAKTRQGVNRGEASGKGS
jgi:NAD(P)-dependent dehydrogenase (short-subunit alcohol dehydrogenase family)